MEQSVRFFPLGMERLGPQPHASDQIGRGPGHHQDANGPTTGPAEPARPWNAGATARFLGYIYLTAVTDLWTADSEPDPSWVGILPRPRMGAIPVDGSPGPATDAFPTARPFPATSRGSTAGTRPAATTTTAPGRDPSASPSPTTSGSDPAAGSGLTADAQPAAHSSPATGPASRSSPTVQGDV